MVFLVGGLYIDYRIKTGLAKAGLNCRVVLFLSGLNSGSLLYIFLILSQSCELPHQSDLDETRKCMLSRKKRKIFI